MILNFHNKSISSEISIQTTLNFHSENRDFPIHRDDPNLQLKLLCYQCLFRHAVIKIVQQYNFRKEFIYLIKARN